MPGHLLYEVITKKLEDFDYEVKSTLLLAVENTDNGDVVCPGGNSISAQSYNFYYTKDSSDAPVRVEYYDGHDGDLIEVADLYTETSVPIQVHYNTKVFKAKALGPVNYSGGLNARLVTKSGIAIDGCTWTVKSEGVENKIINPIRSIVNIAQSSLNNKYTIPVGLAFLGIALFWFLSKRK